MSTKLPEPDWMVNAISSGLPDEFDDETPRVKDPEYKFYDGTVTLRFAATPHEYYEIDDAGDRRVVPGVTTVNGIINKPYLKPYIAKVTIEAIKKLVFKDNGEMRDFSTEEFLEWCDRAKREHTNRLQTAGTIGTLAHDSIETAIKAAIEAGDGVVRECPKIEVKEWHGPVTVTEIEKAQSCANAAFAWMQSHSVRWVHTERKIYSRELDFSGTLDGDAFISSCNDRFCKGCRGRVFQDRRSLVDHKTSNQLSIEYALQTAAYLMAHLEEFSDLVITDRWVIRYGKEDGEFECWYQPPETFEMHLEAFIAALNLYVTLRKAEEQWNTEKREFNAFVRETKKKEREQREAEEKEAKATARRELSEAKKVWDASWDSLYKEFRAQKMSKAEAEAEVEKRMPKSARPGTKDDNENVDAKPFVTSEPKQKIQTESKPASEQEIPVSTVRRIRR